MAEKIGSYLRTVRNTKGRDNFWSLRSVSKRAGISDSYLSQIETGQVKQPSPDTLKKLSLALRHPYEDLLCACAYLPAKKDKTLVSEIPLYGEIPAPDLDFRHDSKKEVFILSRNITGDRKCFAVRIKESCCTREGIFKGDIAVAASEYDLKNGDLVVVKDKKNYEIRKYYKVKSAGKEKIALQCCDDSSDIHFLHARKNPAEILGKVILVLKLYS